MVEPAEDSLARMDLHGTAIREVPEVHKLQVELVAMDPLTVNRMR